MLFFISLLHFVYAYCVRFFRVEHLTVCVTCMDDLRLYANSVVRRQCAVIRVRNGQRRKTKRKKNRRTIVWAYTLPFANIWPKMLHKMRATEIERGENRMFCLFAEKKSFSSSRISFGQLNHFNNQVIQPECSSISIHGHGFLCDGHRVNFFPRKKKTKITRKRASPVYACNSFQQPIFTHAMCSNLGGNYCVHVKKTS